MFFWCKACRQIRWSIMRRNSSASCPSEKRNQPVATTNSANDLSRLQRDYSALRSSPRSDAAVLQSAFGNPSSIHGAGRNARAAVDNARDKIAALIHAKPNEIIFTSGGTEACNLAVLGLARCGMDGSGHVISNKTEHHAVLHAVEHLEKHENFEVTWLDTSNDGMVDLDQLAKSIRPETRLVSIMAANNETGVIQP